MLKDRKWQPEARIFLNREPGTSEHLNRTTVTLENTHFDAPLPLG